MRLLLDENLSYRLKRLLQHAFEEVRHVGEFDLTTTSDGRIWDFARENGYMLLSKDRDFVDRALLAGPPPKVVWIKIGNASTGEIARLLIEGVSILTAFESSPEANFCVLPPGITG